jgi:hypothetical protein
MTTPPPGPGRPGGYPYGTPGQGPTGYGPPGYGPPGYGPPKKGGVPLWAWIVGGIALLLVFCLCGGIGLYTLSDRDETSTAQTVTETPTTEPPTTDPSITTTPTVPSTTAPSSTTTTGPPSTPTQSIPPTPAGSTANTDTSRTLSPDDLEGQIARGMSQYGHTRSEISCSSPLVLVAGRTTSCTAPVPGSSTRRSTVTVETAWAVSTSTQLRYYLTFNQTLG